MSKHCPSSVQAPRNLSKRIFHFKNAPVIIVVPGRRNVPELVLYNIRRGFMTNFRVESTRVTLAPHLLPRPHLEFYTWLLCGSRILEMRALSPCLTARALALLQLASLALSHNSLRSLSLSLSHSLSLKLATQLSGLEELFAKMQFSPFFSNCFSAKFSIGANTHRDIYKVAVGTSLNTNT